MGQIRLEFNLESGGVLPASGPMKVLWVSASPWYMGTGNTAVEERCRRDSVRHGDGGS